MKRPIYLVYRRRRNYRAWLAAAVGVLAFVIGLTLSWPFLLSLLAGAGLGARRLRRPILTSATHPATPGPSPQRNPPGHRA
jgi:predicted branched-subunit amino acid permease